MNPRRSGRKRLSASVRESFRIPDFFSRCSRTGISRSCPSSFSMAARHLQPGPFIRIFARALLLPSPNVLADLGSFRSQLLEAIRATGRRVRRNSCGIDGYVPQLSQPQRARQLHHLREDVVHRSPVALAKLVQRPKIRLRPARQIAKRQIFPNALLQPPRTSHPQRVGIQPHLQQQRWMIGWMSLLAMARFQLSQVQLFHRAMHEKAKMPSSQHFSHRWRQQVSLLRVVLQKVGHPALLLSRQYRASVKPSCHTDSYPLPPQTYTPFFPREEPNCLPVQGYEEMGSVSEERQYVRGRQSLGSIAVADQTSRHFFTAWSEAILPSRM